MKKNFKALLLACLFTSITFYSNAQFANKNQVIAHRGAWKELGLPQNSIASLKQAALLGCYGTEFDVHMTQDEVLVVNHDHDFYGIDIETSTYQELLAKKHPNGESIPTVEEYLKEGLKQKDMKLIFEIKTSKISKERSLKLARLSVELGDKLKANDWVDYICFDYDMGKSIHKLDTSAKIAYLTGDLTPEQLKKDGYTGLDYHYSIYNKNPNWVKQAQDLGLTLNAWTANSPEDIKILLDQNFNYITTDQPALLFELIK